MGGEEPSGEAPAPGGEEWSLVGERLGCYEVRELLGGGGMGRVYAADDTRLGRTVALKVLPPDLAADPSRLARFRREARALAALSHPGIVTIHAIEEEAGLHFLIMERVAGHTLAELIPDGGLPLARLLDLALPLAEALGAAHEAGVVHRDLKPANVMVDSGGRVKLLDFGLARADGEPGGDRFRDSSLTQHGLILGTLPYLSPEQVQGRRADRRSDLFSLGVLLFEMATGGRPFRGETAPELFAAILRDEPPRLRALRPELPAVLEGAVARCLEKDPEHRCAGVAEVVAALRQAADGCAFGSARAPSAPAGAAGVAAPRREPAPVPEGSDPFLTPSPGETPAVGRSEELARLHAWLAEALAGSRRTVFVTGEPGLGKTTLVEAFVREVRRRHRLWLGHGQCLERQGPGEAYMPVLEALGRMGRGDGGQDLVSLLARLAPSWLAQMPALVSAAELAALEHRSLGATQERMLREMVEAVEALSRERPVLLVLEDLHWSDYSTVDLIAALARRPDSARLLLVCTFRSGEAPGETDAVRRVCEELTSRAGRQCFELPVGLLGLEAVSSYLERRFPGADLPDGLPGRVHRHTDGNPLFLEAVTSSWIERGLAAPGEDGRWRLGGEADAFCNEVPPTLRKMIERQLDGLDADACALLDAASVAGGRFSAAAVAAALGLPDEETEDRCDRLAREGRFLRARGSEEWPDGTFSTRFAFVHDLYRQVLYDRLPAARRARIHRQVGERLEAAHRPELRERAAELAVHFVHGRDAPRAVEYLRLAAEHALARSAYREAIDHLHRALEILPRLPEGDERLRAEHALQLLLAPALIAVEGWGAPEAESAYHRARELGELLGDPRMLSPVLYGLAFLQELRGRYRLSETLLEERLCLLRGDEAVEGEPLESYELLACSTFHQGRFSEALAHARAGLGLFVPERHRVLLARENLGVSCHDWAGLALWFLGFPDRAASEAERAIALARELEHPYSESHAHGQAAVVYQCRREPAAARREAQATLDLAIAQGFPFRIATGEIHLGWALAAEGEPEEGIDRIGRGLELYREMGAEMDRAFYLALLAEAQGFAGRAEEALETLAEAGAAAPEDREYFYEAEFHRLRGWLRLRAVRPDEAAAEADFRQALAVAARQGAPSLELRAALDLADLLGKRGAEAEGRRLVADLYRRFEEGFDTLDLRRARDLAAPGETLDQSLG